MSASQNKYFSAGERVLLLLSRDPARSDCLHEQECALGDALSLLRRVFPDLPYRIAGKSIIDFGCGSGQQAVALVKNGARYVVGVDRNECTLKRARTLAVNENIDTGRIAFLDELGPQLNGRFDLVISQNSMEHFVQPREALNEMRSALKQDGRLLITFGPPWFAPYGSHMYFFTKVPWVNLLFSERTVMNVRSLYRHDGARHYEEVESGLGRMSLSNFERLICESGMKVYFKRYDCVKRLDFLANIPVLRELFVNHITCELGLS
jgi:SAM-dependent methyltransferase